MRSIVGQLFKAQRVFAKWILGLAAAVLVLSLTAFGYIWGIQEENASENSIVSSEIVEIIGNKGSLTEEMKEGIVTLINGTDQISQVKIFDVKDVGINSVIGHAQKAEPDFQYDKSVWSPEWLQAKFYPYGNSNGKWYVEMETRHIGSLMGIILFSGLAVYLTLFTIWATINAYHHKRLNTAWIIAFALFNVVGYLLYILVGKRKAAHN